jgi:predicted nucleic acid-binding protein
VAELFVDTSAWYPLVVRTHPDHEPVANALRQQVAAGVRVVTTNLVIAESQALLMRRVGREVALTFAQRVRQPPSLVITSSEALEAQAIEQWLARFTDQSFSLCDAVSFAVMSGRRIEEALTLDRHFAAAGFVMRPGPR